MPELPDVEYYRQVFYHSSLNKKIEDVRKIDNRLLEGVGKKTLVENLKNSKFITTDRHGKYFFAKTDNSKWLVIHFGMTGRFVYQNSKNNIPDYTKAYFEFNNSAISYVCTRRLGKIILTKSKDDFISNMDLGPDAMKLDVEAFKQRIKGRRMIKSALMNQSAIAGIGNIYADEILFHSRIHPKKKVNNMSDRQKEKVFHNMHKVLREAIDKKVDVNKFPASWIIHKRKEDAECPNKCGGKIKKIKINNRSTYYCPLCQKA